MSSKPTCLLTGATGGIGKAIAMQLAQHGYTLMLQGRDLAALKALNDELTGQHHILIGDINEKAARQDIINQAFTLRNPTILINNAGVSAFKHFTSMQDADIDNILVTNLVSTMQLTRLFLSRVDKSNAQIINVGSVLGAIGFPGYASYCASKFGLKGFTEALQRELVHTGTQVRYFAPRATNTSINSSDAKTMNESLGTQVDDPETVAREFIAFLHGNSVRYVVGWPEKFLVRLNGVLPELVDKSIARQSKKILTFITGEQK
ncbi:SDR family oxidoreductase [Thalassotalea mangrovi]|uniref:SDR family oxidoreductase n=1 Tax=Thalassotalea mangrovi TaxID=2572245 RepID=A0A4U1B5P8_9GAMM|nr:SDR family oxidoreductase [Thalassotalea mangrovi]TKB45448.1 SDR family oxidoreductase [Thalassotalea mangrovi]